MGHAGAQLDDEQTVREKSHRVLAGLEPANAGTRMLGVTEEKEEGGAQTQSLTRQ